MHEQPGGREYPGNEIITDISELKFGGRYERIIGYSDGITASTQIFTVNGPVVDDEAGVKLLVTFHFQNWDDITKVITPDDIGLNGPIKDDETTRYVRELPPPNESHY